MNETEVTEGQLLSQDFGVGGPPAVGAAEVSRRPIELITQDIRTHKMAFQYHAQMMLSEGIELGRYLEEAKAALPHGRWGAYLKDEIGLSPSTAQNLMRLFREYGDSQQSLFGGIPKSQIFGNLTYSKALSLLAIPDEEERERFAVENDVEHMSVRELNEALKARDAAEEKAAAAEAEISKLRQEAGLAGAAAQKAQEAFDKQLEKAVRLQDALSEANAAVQAAEEDRARLAQELDELRGQPTTTDTAAETARQAAIAEMAGQVDKANDEAKEERERRKNAEEALAAARKELAGLKAKGPEVRELTQGEKDALTAMAVERAQAADRERLTDLEKQLAVAGFRTHYDAWQKHFGEMIVHLNETSAKDAEQAAKMRNAAKAVVEQWWNTL